MSTDSIIIILSSATLIISGLGIWFGWKWHKAAMRQNLEQELARIEMELKDIEVQQEDANARGAEATRGIYGTNVPNPYAGVSIMLLSKEHALQARKEEITSQLKQL